MVTGYIAKAFPALFPTGNGDFLQPRDIPVTRQDYFEYLMRYKDGRFARDPRFRFLAMNTLQRHRSLTNSNIFVKNAGLKDVTVETMKKKIAEEPNFIKNMMVYSSTLRSTKPYWNTRTAELLSMVEQLGKPTVFFTLSAADYQWPELFRVLAPTVHYDQLTKTQKRQLVNENPVLVSYYIQYRVNIFMQHVMKPIFKVKVYP